MVHPFVRVHIVDMTTSKYLAKRLPLTPGITNKETFGLMENGGKIHEKPVDFLMPMATPFYDMRVSGQNYCQWNEEFVINEYAQDLLNPNVVFLFEILELNSQLIKDNVTSKLNAEMLYPVAWAYLRPTGQARIHLGRCRLQLYKFKFNYDKKAKETRVHDVRTPEVFLDFNFPSRTKYPSYLEVELGFINKSN